MYCALNPITLVQGLNNCNIHRKSRVNALILACYKDFLKYEYDEIDLSNKEVARTGDQKTRRQVKLGSITQVKEISNAFETAARNKVGIAAGNN
jgi:hypothetical protein